MSDRYREHAGCEHTGSVNGAVWLRCETAKVANNPYQQGEPFCSPYNGTGHLSIVQRKNGDDHCGTAVERSRLFRGISPDDCTRICAATRVKQFTRGEMLYMEGDSIRQVLLLTSGCVKVTQLGPSGMEAILRLGVPGDVLDGVSVFSTGKHCTTAQAFRLCQTFVWDAPTFKALVERFPILYQNMARILGDQLLELGERFREVATERVNARVARQLMRLAVQIGRPVNGGIEIGLSRQELAQMTGTTLFTVSRLFSAWGALGMVKPRREAVSICDLRSLRAISE